MTRKIGRKSNGGEGAFLTALKHGFYQAGHYFYKIPDSPGGMRFQLPRPYDAIFSIDGIFGAIEAKYLHQPKAFGLRHLRECQITGLRHVYQRGGRPFVFLEMRVQRGEYRLLWWCFEDFETLTRDKSFTKAELLDMPCIIRQYKSEQMVYDMGVFTEDFRLNAKYYESEAWEI